MFDLLCVISDKSLIEKGYTVSCPKDYLKQCKALAQIKTNYGYESIFSLDIENNQILVNKDTISERRFNKLIPGQFVLNIGRKSDVS